MAQYGSSGPVIASVACPTPEVRYVGIMGIVVAAEVWTWYCTRWRDWGLWQQNLE